MHKLGNLVTLQTNLIVGIALHFQRNIKYHQEVWKNVSVEIPSPFKNLARLPGIYTQPIQSLYPTLYARSFYRCENSLFFPYDLCFIMIILFYPQSAFYPWSAVCSLHFTLILHFTPGLQSAVCSLQSAVCSLQSAFYTDRFDFKLWPLLFSVGLTLVLSQMYGYRSYECEYS